MSKRILVPLDGSTLAEAILPWVIEIAKPLGAELWLLRIAFAHVFPGTDPTAAEIRVVREAEEYLETLAHSIADQGVHVSTAVRYGKAAAEIIDHAAFNKVDLIAMSTHGLSGLSRLVMGSVAEEVVRHAKVPVLLVRAHGEHPDPR